MKNIILILGKSLKYRYLLKQLVIKDIKIKYKKSILGVFWSLLSPLLTMIIITIVFQHLFRFSIEHFSAYLLTGLVLFNFFSDSTNFSLSSIYSSGQIIKKVYVPRIVFPLSKVIFSLFNLFFSFIAIIIVCFYTGVELSPTLFFSFLSILYLFVFSLGVGLILCTIAVFFRDIEHLYNVLLTAWMYATPVIYPIDIIPNKFLFIVYSNPLYYFITHFREALLYGNIPSWSLNIHCISYAGVTLLLGLYIFYKKQDKFILYI